LRQELGEVPPGYERIAPRFSPRPVQARILDLPRPTTGSVVVMEAATGAGKTEAALAHWLRLVHAGQVDGLYFALPTRAAARQIYHRVVQAVEQAFPDPNRRPPVVSALPGYLAVDAVEGVPLPGFQVLWPDGETRETRKAGAPRDFSHRGWAAEHPKRYFAGAVVVGTVDQALLSALQVSHAHLRATALLRHLLVVDEVHASDAYMTRILEEVLARHREAGGHALLMSATLGCAARVRFLARRRSRTAQPPSLAEALATPYPALWVQPEGAEVQLLAVEGADAQKQVRWQTLAEIEAPEAIAARALEAARQGARALVIRNTVAGCQKVQASLEEQAAAGGDEALLFRCAAAGSAAVPAPHHSRFAKVDREELDDALEAAYGKSRPQGGLVVVATQTAEQSLDIDADFLITDLAPIDVLLQRLGRLHRHAHPRPPGYEVARALVLVPAEELGSFIQPDDGKAYGPAGLGTVYDDLEVLEATRRLLVGNPEVEIPRDNRRLVEAGIHPEVLAALEEELGAPWPKHRQAILGRELADGQIARLNGIDRTLPFGDPNSLFPGRDQQRKIPTRLGLDDRIVHFPQPPPGPFGQPIAELRIPGHLVEKAPPRAEDEEAQAVTEIPGGFEFRFGRWSFRYTRLGLERLGFQQALS